MDSAEGMRDFCKGLILGLVYVTFLGGQERDIKKLIFNS